MHRQGRERRVRRSGEVRWKKKRGVLRWWSVMTLAQPCLHLPRPLAVAAQMTYALINSAEPPTGCRKSPNQCPKGIIQITSIANMCLFPCKLDHIVEEFVICHQILYGTIWVTILGSRFDFLKKRKKNEKDSFNHFQKQLQNTVFLYDRFESLEICINI